MIRSSAALALCGVVITVAPANRAENGPPSSEQPTLYQDLARADAMVDAAARNQ